MGELADAETGVLNGKHELALMNLLNDYSGTVESAARELSPHLIAYYLKDLAGEFHSYYNAEQFLVPDDTLRLARLALITAVRQALRNGLTLLGVGSPEKM
jgi:arginyl-tRNA synthetase